MKIILSESQVKKIMDNIHDDWKEKGGKLVKTYSFPTYQEVIDFVVKVSEVAEKQNHHPEMVVGHDTVKVMLFDHEKGEVSDKCHKFTKSIDKMVDSEESLDERKRTLSNTRKKVLFPRSAMMANPNRFKEYDKEVKSINEEKSEDLFDEFADTRMGGAEKIAKNAKEKGGFSMLTYHHFVVKLPYYKKASEGKFNMEDSKKEFTKTLKSISLNMNQTDFQREVGRLEVLGELLIKHKGK
jgi:4a-hydroxytetrahydrobiopterin dehydratase